MVLAKLCTVVQYTPHRFSVYLAHPCIFLSHDLAVGTGGNPRRVSGTCARLRPWESCGLVTVAAESAHPSHPGQTMPLIQVLNTEASIKAVWQAADQATGGP
jgi:hypothetical protein